MEQKVIIPCDNIQLEGRFRRSNGTNGVVVMHPHPLYGGAMDNPVVETITRSYARLEYSTLRFNFRGAGGSGGAFDNGRGEQRDILACIDFLVAAGIRVTDLAGYSFGAWVLSKLSPLPESIERTLLVAPPVAFMDFSDIKPPLADIRAITGSHDDFAPPDTVEDWLASGDNTGDMTLIQDADHFFTGRLHQLEDAISRAERL
jgi:alpha/beta superfamily hydrolase